MKGNAIIMKIQPIFTSQLYKSNFNSKSFKAGHPVEKQNASEEQMIAHLEARYPGFKESLARIKENAGKPDENGKTLTDRLNELDENYRRATMVSEEIMNKPFTI